MRIRDIIDKLSSYNLFNYLFPGFLFAIALKHTTSLIPEEWKLNVISIVVIYFIGLVISRVGSLVIEEILKRIVFIGKILTKELFEAIEKSVKIEIIFEAMNMYRSLASMSLLLFFLTIVDGFINPGNLAETLLISGGELILFVLFLFAFCKQRRKVLQCLPDYNKVQKKLFKKKNQILML